MSGFPVADPATFLPLPKAVEVVSDDALVAAWKAQFGALWPAYNTGVLEFDTAPIIAEATALLRMLDRERINDVYDALRLARASGTDLDGLAADLGLTRIVFAVATATSDAVVERDPALRLRCWLRMQEWSLGSSCLGITGRAWRLALEDVSDIEVFDFPGQGRIRCMLLPAPGLDPARLPALLARVGGGLNARDRRPGSVPVETALAEVLTADVDVTIGVRRGASKAAAKRSAETAVRTYMAERRQIGERVAVSLIEGEAAVSNVIYAHLTSFAADLLPTREQAYQLGRLSVTPEDADA